MRRLGLRGIVRGKRLRTTRRDPNLLCPEDRVHRIFFASRPNELWVSDFTYVSTWLGWVLVAFIVDACARCIVGWKVSSTANTDFVLDALEQALHARGLHQDGELIHHSDHGSQYLAVRFTDRLTQAGVNLSVGSVGDSFDNALAETVN